MDSSPYAHLRAQQSSTSLPRTLSLPTAGPFGCGLFSFTRYVADRAAQSSYLTGLLLASQLCMNSLFRFFAYIAPSLPTATSLAGAGTGLMLIFGGFVITRSNLQDYDLGAYYLSPFSWTVRSLVVNGTSERPC